MQLSKRFITSLLRFAQLCHYWRYKDTHCFEDFTQRFYRICKFNFFLHLPKMAFLKVHYTQALQSFLQMESWRYKSTVYVPDDQTTHYTNGTWLVNENNLGSGMAQGHFLIHERRARKAQRKESGYFCKTVSENWCGIPVADQHLSPVLKASGESVPSQKAHLPFSVAGVLAGCWWGELVLAADSLPGSQSLHLVPVLLRLDQKTLDDFFATFFSSRSVRKL